ncbi:MAG TPA: phosphate acyltransferase PlsX [Gemmatimonadales bacterium]|nr:phosphate acyltransferase PlsX [Gemmatimonadales bacterium]
MIRIALDAMGGDHAPAAEVDGAALALRELDPDFTLVLVGRREAIEEHLARHPELDRSRLEIVDAPEVIGMGEKPLQAVRRKPDSSLVVGLGLHRDGHADAFVSAGNTGACLAASTIVLGLHDGVDRATVASLLPAAEGPILLLDAGANVDCSVKELVNFAYLGSIYMRDVLGRTEPRVGLLNVGEEDEKGNAIAREAHAALKAHERLHYVGNIEGRDVVVPHPVHGRIDVVVCDGFVGNIVLKFYESIGKLVGNLMKRESPALLTNPDMQPLMRFLDYSQYGGAPLLGVKGVPVFCHGSSSANAIKNAIRKAVESVRGDLSAHIAAEFALSGHKAES